ncbi:MAG: glutamine synthetase type III, partial [Clostridiales bacterium]|nr:glutamine synthetase type III [Clostridiales bacterium]
SRVGSDMFIRDRNIACPNIMINAAVADVLNTFADELEKVKAADFKKAATELVKREYIAHRRIVFNGDNYADAWVEEAAKRGLLNLKSTPEALSYYDRPENVELFDRLKIYTDSEVHARKDILLENYCKVINIEAGTMSELVLKQILPAAIEFSTVLADNVTKLNALKVDSTTQTKLLAAVSELIQKAYVAAQKLSDAQAAVKNAEGLQKEADLSYSKVVSAMNELREYCDKLETVMPKDLWPFPSYSDMLLYV